MHERLKAGGRIRFHAFPAEYDEAILREICRMTLEERAREALSVVEFPNIITLNGHSAIATVIGTSGTSPAFAQYLGIGTTPIISVGSGDTSVPGEFFRQVNAGFLVVGTLLDVEFVIAAGSGNATYASAGIFGNGATGTLGSGTLYTHALTNYTKSGQLLVVDYLITIN